MIAEEDFNILINEVVDASTRGDLMDGHLYNWILEQLPNPGTTSGIESIALAVGRLTLYCDWDWFDRASERHKGGTSLDDLHKHIQPTDEEGFYNDIIVQEEAPNLAEGLASMRENESQYFRELREFEQRMGFDEATTSRVVELLGPWDKTVVPMNFLDLLPSELIFPFHRSKRVAIYDHRIHLLVLEFVTRIQEGGKDSDEVVKNCGHLIARFFSGDDKEAGTRLIQDQLILLADDYVQDNPYDLIGLCWRGQLACWNDDDDDVAMEHAKMVWQRSIESRANTLANVISFFAKSREMSWEELSDSSDNFLDSRLGDLKASWIDREEPLVAAIIRRSSMRGTWDTSLLCSALPLPDCTIDLSSDCLSTECWVWMAEHSHQLRLGVLRGEIYFDNWSHAFDTLSAGTDPKLAHNIVVILLTGQLLGMNGTIRLPSIQRLLDELKNIHRNGSLPNEKTNTLKAIQDIFEKMSPDQLNAADRMAIVKSITGLERTTKSESFTQKSERAETILKTTIGELIWSKLSSKARDLFTSGELQFIIESEKVGEQGNFKSFVMNFSHGLLHEILESIGGPLQRDKTLKEEHIRMFGETTEWNDLINFIDCQNSHIGSRLIPMLMAQRVRLNQIGDLRGGFIKLRDFRNRAAHVNGRCIDRAEADRLHGFLTEDGGFIRIMIEYFPKLVQR